jgi:hypothetical protein
MATQVVSHFGRRLRSEGRWFECLGTWAITCRNAVLFQFYLRNTRLNISLAACYTLLSTNQIVSQIRLSHKLGLTSCQSQTSWCGDEFFAGERLATPSMHNTSHRSYIFTMSFALHNGQSYMVHKLDRMQMYNMFPSKHIIFELKPSKVAQYVIAGNEAHAGDYSG